MVAPINRYLKWPAIPSGLSEEPPVQPDAPVLHGQRSIEVRELPQGQRHLAGDHDAAPYGLAQGGTVHPNFRGFAMEKW